MQNQQQICCLLHIKLHKYAYIIEFQFYRKIDRAAFPVIITCTLQGFSVTQGNPVTFTANTFAVHGRHNFWATTLRLWGNEYFYKMFKKY